MGQLHLCRPEDRPRNTLAGSILGLCVAVLLGSAPVVGQAGADPTSSFADRSQVVAIEIPVQVTLDGEPVRGLSEQDFEVLEGRKTRPLVDFEVIDLSLFEVAEGRRDDGSGINPSQPFPAAGARRHFLLLFDLSFSAPESIFQAQTAALDLLDGGLHPSDLVAVATYSSLSGPRLLLGFSPDRKQAALAVETLGLPQLTRPVADPLGLIFGDLDAAEQGFSSGRGSDLVTETLQDFARLMERQDKRRYEDRVRAMTQSMGDLATLLRNAPGRKHVVFLSEGFDTSVFFGEENEDARNRQNQALESGRVWEVSSEDRFGDSSAQNALEDMFREFRRADCRIDSVDIGGIQASTNAALGGRRATSRQNSVRRGRQDGLATLASSTGGEFIRNHNDLTQAMGEIQRRTSVTYMLTIQPPNLEWDGRYRRLKVRLKDGPKGARLTHRPGYFAPTSWQETSAGGRQLIAAGQVLGGTSGGRLSVGLTASALPAADSTRTADDGSPLPAERAYVPLMVEIDGGPLSAAPRGDDDLLQGQIFIYAMDGAGQVRAYLDHSVAVDLRQAGPALAAGGLKFFGDLELAPGDYMIRAFVRHQGSEYFGFAGTPLYVPDYVKGEAGALPPLFPEPPERWMMLREETIPGVEPPPFPYLNGQQPFLPAARPAFAAGPIEAAVALHHVASATPRINARVLDGADKEQRAKVEPVGRQPQVDADRPGLSRWPLKIDGRRLAPGDYALEVTVTDDAGLRSVRRSPFQITGQETPSP